MWKADDLDLWMLWISYLKCDLVDAIERGEARVSIALHVVVSVVAVGDDILLEVLADEALGKPEARSQRLRTAGAPVLHEGAVLCIVFITLVTMLMVLPLELPQRHLFPLDELPVMQDLEPRKEGIFHAEDLRLEPDLHQPRHPLHCPLLENKDASALMVGLPIQVVHGLGAVLAPFGSVDARSLQAAMETFYIAPDEVHGRNEKYAALLNHSRHLHSHDRAGGVVARNARGATRARACALYVDEPSTATYILLTVAVSYRRLH
mmetsp:Transcript_22308/g.47499  ORF Transcript_22308/g.47499 Transcript_22308/m.47499 type:complete len:264 (+) Transcript_22308:2033-2824(+)